jgi:hypothetical protein
MRLSRALATAGALALVGAPLAAQQMPAPTTNRPSFGVIVGVNSANVRGDGAAGDARTGLVVGATALWAIGSSGLGFQPELHYSQKGSKDDFDGIGGTLAFSYIELPLHLRYSFGGSAARVRPYLLGGPTLGYRTGCSIEGGGISIDCDDVGELAGEEGFDFERFHYGLSVGGGVDFPLAGRTGTVTARFNQGLSDLVDGSSARNRTIQLGLGLRF